MINPQCVEAAKIFKQGLLLMNYPLRLNWVTGDKWMEYYVRYRDYQRELTLLYELIQTFDNYDPEVIDYAYL